MADIEEKVVFTGDASQLTQTFDELVNAITRTKEEIKEYKNDKEKSAELTKKLYDQEMKLVELMSKQNNVIDSSKVSYRQLNDILKDLNKTYKETTSGAQRMNIAPAAKAMNQELKTMDANIGNFQRNVGNYSGDIQKAFQGLQLQTSQVLRELPSLKYGVEMFFLAISNNLPMLIDAVKKYNDLNKARKASAAAAAGDAATHRAETTETTESAIAHDKETTAVGASTAAHIKEGEALVANAKSQLERAEAAKKAALEERNLLMSQKEGVDMTIKQMMANINIVQSDQEHIIKLRELNTLKSEASRLDLALATAENNLAAAETRVTTATNQLAVAEKTLEEERKNQQGMSWLKAMGKAILSWQTLVLGLILVLTLYSKEIAEFVGTLFTGNKEMDRFKDATDRAGVSVNEFTKNATNSTKAEDQLNKSLLQTEVSYSKTANASSLFHKEQKELNKAVIEGAKSFAKQYVEIRLLMSIMNQAALQEAAYANDQAQLAQAQEEHNKAAEKMLEMLGETVNETNVAAVKTGEYADKIDALVASLYKQAQAQGAIQLLQKVYTETVLKAQGELIDAELDKQAGKFKNFWSRLGYWLSNTWKLLEPSAQGETGSKEDWLDRRVKKWEEKLGEAKTTFEAYLAEITKMFDFDSLFGDDKNSGKNGTDKWFSRWEMRINELVAKMGMLAEKNGDINLADTWKYSEQGMTYYMNKFDEYAAHYRKVNKDLKDEDNKDLREVEVQRKKYIEEYYKYHNELSKKYLSAIQTEKDKELSDLIDWYNKEVAIYQQMGEDITNLDNEYEKRREAILDKYIDKYKNVDMVRQAIDERYNEYYNAMMDYELAQLQDQMTKEIKEYERKGIETTNLEEHYAIERLKIISKYAKEETQARLAEYQKQEDAALRRNAVETNRKMRTGGKNTKTESIFSSMGGTTVTGMDQRNAEIAGLEEEKRIYVESANLQIAEMQRVLDSGKLFGEERLEMEKSIADAKNELELGTLELQEQIEEKKAENAKATFEEITQYAQQGFQGLGGMFDNVYTAIERTYELQVKEGKMTEKEAEKELEKYRGVKAAAAAMDALGSAVGAYNSLATIPYVGPALGAAAAAAALAAGFANVKLILATTKDNAGVGGADTYSPNLSEFTPQFVANATGRDDTDYLVNALEEKPIRAYIVESEVTAAQEVENKRNQETTW